MQAAASSPTPEVTLDDEHAVSGFKFGLPAPSRRATFGQAPPYANQVKRETQRALLKSSRERASAPFAYHADSRTTLPTGSETSAAETSTDDRTTSEDSGSPAYSRSGSLRAAVEAQQRAQPHVNAGTRLPHRPTTSNSLPEADNNLDSSGSAAAQSAKTSLQHVLNERGTSQIKPNLKPPLDVLSREIFLEALQNPPVRFRLQKFTQTSFFGEYMSFLDQVSYHKKMIDESTKAMAEIDSLYLSPDSATHIDLSSPAHEDLRADIETVVKETHPSVGSIFNHAELAVQNAIFDHVYEEFVRTQLALSASEALSNDRHRYQGLGDCFCLTDPSKADNPIMFASDGFVAVTGYERKEVIPRNCRFLQGRQTNSLAARRIGLSVRKNKENVDFLLNYRKNGEPFWNLLYTAPLFDSAGRVAFFLGGQVNCSSSVHSRPDIMRVLAASSEHERDIVELAEKEEKQSAPAKLVARRVEQARKLRYRQQAEVEEEPGAERRLVGRDMDAEPATRIESFYNAYSKYFVTNYPSFDIQFVSDGIGDVLQLNESPAIGANAFKFLKQHMLSKDKSDWKFRIETALKIGRPISLALHLRTRRSAIFRGDEKYLTHWTPLKDLGGKTKWVVVCLCPTLR